jgi:hypothetical protein
MRRYDFIKFIYFLYNYSKLKIIKKYFIIKLLKMKWGLGIGDWGLGIGDWAQSPIPNPHFIFTNITKYF